MAVTDRGPEELESDRGTMTVVSDNDIPQRLLAVGHEGSQTGAPIVLASMLEWLSENADVSVHTLLIKDGPLRSRFERVGSVSSIEDRAGSWMLGLAERGLVFRKNLRASKLPAALRYAPEVARLGRFDLVYLNSLTTLEILPYLKHPDRVVAHVHEGPVTIGGWQAARDLMPLRRGPDHWITVSEDSAEAIRALPGVDPETVSVHHPFIDVARVRGGLSSSDDHEALRTSLGIPPNASVVVGSGSVERRKGPDLFVQLAAEVERRCIESPKAVHFVWVGGDAGGRDWPLLEAEVKQSGAQNVHLVSHVENPARYYQLADVFALTSREDPFPLVCLESAAMGIPIVAYSSSGIRSFLTDAGENAAKGVIQYLDVDGMANRIFALLNSPSESKLAASQAGTAVSSRHDIATAAPQICKEMGL